MTPPRLSPGQREVRSSAPIRVLVCGGRNFDDREAVLSSLDQIYATALHRSVIVIQGGANGADYWAKRWAELLRLPCMSFPADWATHGRAAGPIRNACMLAESRPDLVLAFPGGAGTRDMCRKAEAAGVKVRRVGW